jgi:6-phosphogluconolactonase (cycloisomerase 2 family)
MRMKFRFLQHVLLPALLLCLMACSTNSTLVNGNGLLFVTAQANTTLSVYGINLSNGTLSTVGSSVGTGAAPAAIAITPALDALFVANSGSNDISSYTTNSDGSLAAVSGTTKAGNTPMGLAIDPGGKFLFVANQGSSNISAFTIGTGGALTAVPGSPFTTIPVGLSYPNGTLPVGVAVSGSGKFLYVANQLSNFVSVFSINSTSGALTASRVAFYATGDSPSGLGISPNGGFLYVMNAAATSNNVSAFAICDIVVTSCLNPTSPDGTLTPVAGSPFAAGLGPVAIAFDLNFDFAYVVDKGSNTISQYSWGPEDGVLTPLSPATISTGLTPLAMAIRTGATGTNIGNITTNPTDYAYVANEGAGSISIYTLTTSTGLLNVLGMPILTFGQTSALVVR